MHGAGQGTEREKGETDQKTSEENRESAEEEKGRVDTDGIDRI